LKLPRLRKMRFVIHHHLSENEHYDLMIETEEKEMLTTWRITPVDLALLQKNAEIKAKRIQDHKKFFLDYEGPLSRGKGRVKLYDSGICGLNRKDGKVFKYSLSGKILKGIIRIAPAEQGYSYIHYS
jgi:hypothetical protein